MDVGGSVYFAKKKEKKIKQYSYRNLQIKSEQQLTQIYQCQDDNFHLFILFGCSSLRGAYLSQQLIYERLQI